MTPIEERHHRLSRGLSAVCALVGVTGLSGWILDIRALRSVLPFWVQIKANTAFGLLAAGVSLWLANRAGAGRWASRLLAAVVFALGALTFLQYHLHLDFGIDQLLFREPPGEISTASPGRMAHISALSFALGGLALGLLDVAWGRWRPTQWLALTVFVIATAGLLGYVLGTESMLPGDYTHMAAHAALAFTALALGLLFARPSVGVMALASSRGPGGDLVRRVLPAMIAVLIALAGAQQAGLRALILGRETSASTLLLGNLLALSWLLVRVGRQLDGSEVRFRQAFESPMAGIALWSAGGQVVSANEALWALLQRWRGVTAQAGQLSSRDLPLPAAAGGRIEHLVRLGPSEVELQAADGEALTVLVSAAAPHDGQGSYFVLDVTDKKRADERLRKLDRKDQEQRQIHLQQAVLSGIGNASGLDESLSAVVRAVAESAGAAYAEAWLPSADGLVRSPASYPGGERFALLASSAAAHQGLRAGRAVSRAFETRRPVWSRDLRESHAPRAALAVQAGLQSAVALPVLAGDEVAAVLLFAFAEAREEDPAFVQLVSAAGHELGFAIRRKKAEDALRASELRFRSVAQSASDAIVSLDDHGTVLSWNRAAEQIFGRSEADMVGRPMESVMPERFREAHRKGMARVHAGAPSRLAGQRIELACLRADGSEFPVELSVGAWVGPAGRYFTGILRDISDRKRAELELRKVNEGLRRTVEELEQRNREAAELGALAELLQGCGSTADGLRVLEDRLPRLFPGSSGAVLLADPARNLVESAAAWGAKEVGEEVFTPSECWALRRGRSHRGGDGGSVACEHAKGSTEPRVCIGLQANGEVVGVLTLRWEKGAPAAGDAALGRVLSAATDQAALALASLKLRDTLRMQAVRDSLTGLYNRRYLEETLDRELRRAQRKSRKLSLIICDVDHFKRFNDTHGHALGDLVLREVARTLQEAVRGDDVVCRYGGEEFVVVLPEAGLEDAVRRAEDMRTLVRALRIPVGGGVEVDVSLSFGVADFPQNGAASGPLLKSADAALYRAKREGRDRVVAAPSGIDAAA